MKTLRPYSIPVLVFILGTFLIGLFDGTGDHGDSVQHFLIAKNSWKNPSLFFDHWGKPLFTLLASPFAQFDWLGMKLFNLLLFCGSLWFVHRMSDKTGGNPVLGQILLIGCPLLFPQIFSGLTEFLFAFILLWALWMCFRDGFLQGAILLSFLPFVRSEGWIMIILSIPFFLLLKKWKQLPWLLLGTVTYSIIGWPVTGNPLWVFTQTPYVNHGDNYGNGSFSHFANQLFYWCGPLVCLAFAMGIVVSLSRWKHFTLHRLWILSIIIGYVGAHSIFWSTGIFHSMGLARVMIAVFPFLAIVGSWAISQETTQRKWQKVLLPLFCLAVLLFPLSTKKKRQRFKASLELHQSQKDLNAFIAKAKDLPNLEKKKLRTEAPWARYLWEKESREYEGMHSSEWQTGDLILLEPYFSELEGGITKTYLQDRGARLILPQNAEFSHEQPTLWLIDSEFRKEPK